MRVLRQLALGLAAGTILVVLAAGLYGARDAPGRKVEAKGDTYIEGTGAYRLQVDIAPDFTVRVRYRDAWTAQ